MLDGEEPDRHDVTDRSRRVLETTGLWRNDGTYKNEEKKRFHLRYFGSLELSLS